MSTFRPPKPPMAPTEPHSNQLTHQTQHIKSHQSSKIKRYSSSLDDYEFQLEDACLNGWQDAGHFIEQHTNTLYHLSAKLKTYERRQKKKEQEVLLSEIKENYKNIIGKAKEHHYRPKEVFSKYKDQAKKYEDEPEVLAPSQPLPTRQSFQGTQTVNRKELAAALRPLTNQIITARSNLDQEKVNLMHNFTKKAIEKHKSQKTLTEHPQTSSLLMKSKMSRVEKVKRWMNAIDFRSQREKQRERAVSQVRSQGGKVLFSNLMPNRTLRKLEMPTLERRPKIMQKKTKLNITSENEKPACNNEFQDTKLFVLR